MRLPYRLTRNTNVRPPLGGRATRYEYVNCKSKIGNAKSEIV
jgi:hypothetical protein